MSYCYITEEYAGLNRSGGIGSCARGLVELLRGAGYSFDVLITDLSCNSASPGVPPQSYHAGRFLFLSDLVRSDKAVFEPVDAITRAYCVYRYLRSRGYTVVHFNEWMGSGFYCAMARRQGLFPSVIVTHLHGSTEWVRHHNLHAPELEDLEREGIERFQIENSDLVISPSTYLLEWYRAQGVRLPQSRRLNWFLPQWHAAATDGSSAEPLSTGPIAAAAISELIFFGRHERRKGFEIFVDAASRLPKNLQPDLTFIGRFDRVGREFSGSHVFRKLASYGGWIRFLNDLNQADALARILRSRGALCVMPSVIENSPCVVGECFTIGVPFITTDVGGTSELIDHESRPHCTVAPSAEVLAATLERILRQGIPPLRSTLVPRDIARDWIECHKLIDAIVPVPAENPSSSQKPLVSVCVTHYERPALLRQAVECLLAQSYDHVEIIIVDDGSRRPDAHAYLDELETQPQRFPIKIIRSSNRYLGAARNLAASHARGDYLLFHDDDNLAEPDEIEVFVAAALSSGYDILTSMCWFFREGSGEPKLKERRIEYYPIGVGGPFSWFRNRFGDANALIRRATFDSLGGFSELYGVGLEDWELFLKAYLQGKKIGVVPEPLFNYRVSADGMLATGNVVRNHERLYALIDKERPTFNSDVLRYAQGPRLQQQALAQLRAALKKAPAGKLHRQLTVLDPNSPEARAKLSDLALSIGRVADGIEIGIQDFQQRERILNRFAQGPRPPTISIGQRTIVAPDAREGTPVVVLRGWAFAHGRAWVPQGLRIDSQRYVTIGHLDESRPDVMRQFRLASGEHVGFVLAAKQSARKSRLADLISTRRRLETSSGTKIELLVSTGRALSAHIDELQWCREVTVRTPEPGLWYGTITVETEMTSYILFKDVGGAHISGTRTADVQTKLRGIDTKAVVELTLIIPSEGRTDIIFE